MAKLVYASIVSLDGHIEDQHGSFNWAVPDDEVHAFINDLERKRHEITNGGWREPGGPEPSLTNGHSS